MTIRLPIPSRDLWPNARTHPMKRQRFVRLARQHAFFATLEALGVVGCPTRLLARDRQRLGIHGPLCNASYRRISLLLMPVDPPAFTGYSLAFLFRDARRRDDDNAAASCKAYRDGIADALRRDDSSLPLLAPPSMMVDGADPRLEITLHLLADALP